MLKGTWHDTYVTIHLIMHNDLTMGDTEMMCKIYKNNINAMDVIGQRT